MAQLVARLTGSQKVRDSNSLVSTSDGLLNGRNKKERITYVPFFVVQLFISVSQIVADFFQRFNRFIQRYFHIVSVY